MEEKPSEPLNRLDFKKPPKPEYLIDALQDSIHIEVGNFRPVRAVRVRRKIQK